MKIKNVKVFNPIHGFIENELSIKGEVIVASDFESDDLEIDGKNCYAIPGLIDIHLHGGNGSDFCDGTVSSLSDICSYELFNGVTSLCATTMTLPSSQLSPILENIAAYSQLSPKEESRILGIYLEGPFLSASKKGAQNGLFLTTPDCALLDYYQALSHHQIKICAIAPELPDAMEFITKNHDTVTITLAHTTADYATSSAAFLAGASQVTHLFNAMPPFASREPGLIGAAADHKNVFVELICDGIHVHPSMIRSTFSLFGEDRIVMISDSMMATGMPDGTYSLGNQSVSVHGQDARLTDGGALAGSVSNLMECLRFTVKTAGIPLEKAIKCVTTNPAKVLHVESILGSLEPGMYADILLIDEDLNIKMIVYKGRCIQNNF